MTAHPEKPLRAGLQKMGAAMPSEHELRAMQALAAGEQQRARRIEQLARDQTGEIREAKAKKAKRNASKQARRRNRR